MKYFKFAQDAILPFILLSSMIFVANTMAQSVSESIITDPSISRRCDDLMQQRQDKVQHRQRLLFLLDRNKNLLKDAPDNKVSIAKKLRANQYKVIQELKITNLKVIKLEEQIVRRGCPGLTL
ncbi:MULTISPECIES: hypothetical protein [Halobacteriovorax]|uniref:Secreted protein n=1 Tax=Halobacteriovorax vibrionivorans TaxID=2152716 RepID=A0ABY0IH24_9BACT|nr:MULTISPECIES: hypothetical protein [Halobacteriovorax]RZF22240.1 hypothetical protein DAY19_00290 [Halobacteriovorax vibrionivorans]TGD48492.1 hypothetical protein EP118_03205 [Halobacteriovorax sp. Y22]